MPHLLRDGAARRVCSAARSRTALLPSRSAAVRSLVTLARAETLSSLLRGWRQMIFCVDLTPEVVRNFYRYATACLHFARRQIAAWFPDALLN